MNCEVCGHANREEARFCEECANPLRRSCASCGAELRAQARFCDQCGAPVSDAVRGEVAVARSTRAARDYTPKHLVDKILTSRAAMEGERKRVTVLFADMKGSQELAEHIDPEQWHRILDRFFGILTGGIHRFEGTINQYTGDGIMALFGAPIAHEDHALRACHAALAVMVELRRFADELRLTQGLNLSMRIGINTGEVVVGRIGDDLRMDYTAQGHTVGLAARMEQIAEPGRIYLTRNTAALVEGYFRLRDLGEMDVKGSKQPLRVYELEAIGSVQTRLDMSRTRGLSRFIGREQETALLGDALARAREGEGQVVGVVGNAGLGKSRLCFEFTERCRAQGMAVHKATGVTYGSALPLFPVVTLMRSYFGIAEVDSAPEARRKIAGTLLVRDPALKDLLPLVFDFLGVAETRGAGSELPPDVQQEKLLEVLGLLYAGDRTQATVVLIEDLHWMDPGSELFLARLVELTLDTPNLLVFNYRPEFMADWLTGRIDSEIALSALSGAELQQLSSELLGHAEGMDALGDRIRARAGGNPFFVEEAVHGLVASGHLGGSTGAFTLLKPVETLIIPDTVQAIIAARIDRLGEREKEVLQHAAVVGREFSRERLDTLTELPAAEMEESLAALEELGFVNQGDALSTGQYAFCHPLTQEVAYQSQLGEHRARIHARLAADIESGVDPAQPPDERSVLLAHHWEQAGQLPKALAWNLKAATWNAFRDLAGALARYRRVIALTDTMPVSPEQQQLAAAARTGILRMSGLVPVPDEEVERAYAEAQAIVDASGDLRTKADLIIAYGARRMNLGDALGAFENINEGMRLGREAGMTDLVARLRLPILITYFSLGKLREAIDLMEASSPGGWASRPMSAENVGSRAYRANFLTFMGRLHEARREIDSAIRISSGLGRTVSWMHGIQVQVAYFAGDTDTVQRDAQTAVRAAEEFDSPFFRLFAYNSLATAHLLQGHWSNALEILERTLPLVEARAPGRQFAAVHLSNMAEANLGLGDSARAVQLAQESLALSLEGHIRIWEGRSRLQLIRALLAARTPAAAAEIERQLAAWQKVVDEIGAVIYQPFIHEQRARLAELTGDTERARREFERATVLYREFGADARAAALQKELPARRRA